MHGQPLSLGSALDSGTLRPEKEKAAVVHSYLSCSCSLWLLLCRQSVPTATWTVNMFWKVWGCFKNRRMKLWKIYLLQLSKLYLIYWVWVVEMSFSGSVLLRQSKLHVQPSSECASRAWLMQCILRGKPLMPCTVTKENYLMMNFK